MGIAMTTDSLTELESLARAATPGPWIADGPHVGKPREFHFYVEAIRYDAPTLPRDIAAYIAALSPERVLALIAIVRAADAMHAEYDQDLYTTATNKAYKAARAAWEDDK
jgi:hypothetical protein